MRETFRFFNRNAFSNVRIGCAVGVLHLWCSVAVSEGESLSVNRRDLHVWTFIVEFRTIGTSVVERTVGFFAHGRAATAGDSCNTHFDCFL